MNNTKRNIFSGMSYEKAMAFFVIAHIPMFFALALILKVNVVGTLVLTSFLGALSFSALTILKKQQL